MSKLAKQLNKHEMIKKSDLLFAELLTS